MQIKAGLKNHLRPYITALVGAGTLCGFGTPFYWDVCLELHALSPKPAFKYPNNKICQAGYLRAI